MQPGYPAQDPYGQQPHQDPTSPQYQDPYAQPPAAPQYGQHDPYAAPQAPGQPYGQQPYQDPYAQQQPYAAAPGYPAAGYPTGQGQNNTLGLIGMITGILSIVFALCCTPLGILSGIAGVVLGVMGQKKAQTGEATNPGQAKAGLICGAIGIVLCIISAIAGAAINLNNFGS